ncbi:hypothetical protein HF325_001254 [Metschnikowia pulcherrima]|uniref:RING-type domain-containing protein n=1 Tax=Metschnikowia pulcherrima TaxID=27326 RepID=A0A8H7LBD8_9ASCO|nr:hypothetical protein HF325_001254 [Metschnikowia pulcherrima]
MSTSRPPIMSFTPTATARPSSSNTPAANTVNGTSFVGNTPSTVLFFLAMAVGVAIAFLFIFFTARYFVRAKYGLHLYSPSSRGMMFLPRANSVFNPVAYTDREIQEHLEYLRSHHFLRDDFLERRLHASSGRRRRRRRRGRFAKMKKLTAEEVESLFPQLRYADWLNTGEDAVSESSSMSNEAQKAADPAHDVVEVSEQPACLLHNHDLDVLSLTGLLRVKTELHFDSGSCSICLEIYELDDIVRGLICGHVFHAECVDPWLIRRRACCPICKRDYIKEEDSTGATTNTNNIEEEVADELDDMHRNLEGFTSRTGEAITDEDPSGNNPENNAQEPARSANNDNSNDNEITGAPNSVHPNSTGATDPVRYGATPNEQSENNDDRDDNRNTLRDLNFDVIRADLNIQALLNELVPLSERVRVLLDEHPELNMESRAKETSNRLYGNIFKMIFWKLMGISKKDLYNWAVIKIYQEELAPLGTTTEDNETSQGHDASAEQSVRNDSNDVRVQDSVAETVEMQEIRRAASSATMATSVYHNAETDLADVARRREAVEDRV